jgi:hypothetical protein
MRYSHQALIGVIIVSAVIIFFYIRNHRKKQAVRPNVMS